MSLSNISRSMLDALLPDGPLWVPETEKDFDLFLDGQSLSLEDMRIFLEKIAFFRDPYNTPILSDLEKEYGIITRENLDIETRIANLALKVYGKNGAGSEDDLESALKAAGFDVNVYQNDPPADPADILGQYFQLVTGDTGNAFTGDPGAYLGQGGGYLLVNGPILTGGPIYLGLGDANAFVGDPLAITGYFIGIRTVEKTYNIPIDPDLWPFVFFVGGEATRADVVEVITSDGNDVITSDGYQVVGSDKGQITSIQPAEIPIARRREFEKIILRYKPLFTWAGLVVIYI